MNMNSIMFFTTDGCHLCELAREMLKSLGESEDIAVEIQDISEAEVLVEKYGLLIPVLMDKETGKELRWPFDSHDITEWISCNSR
ncbi:MAG: glutaredoxin family protein [Gammaproteobacteria bacterium]|nr:glutaredoxin family protein [Gammaproteobacteria bacterium]